MYRIKLRYLNIIISTEGQDLEQLAQSNLIDETRRQSLIATNDTNLGIELWELNSDEEGWL